MKLGLVQPESPDRDQDPASPRIGPRDLTYLQRRRRPGSVEDHRLHGRTSWLHVPASSPPAAPDCSAGPGQLKRTELAGEGRHVVGRPLLADLAVILDAVDVDRVPGDRLAGGRDPEQVTLLGRAHYQAYDH